MDYLKPVQWADSLSVGVKLIDDEHNLLLSIFNDLVNALRKADELLATVKAREKSVVLFSDLPKSA